MTRVRVQTFEETGTTGQVFIRDTASPTGGAWGASGGGGGGVTITATTIDVPFGRHEQTVTVIDAACTGASKVVVNWGATLVTDENQPSMGNVTFSAVPTAGSFDVTVSSDEPVGGAYKILYTLG